MRVLWRTHHSSHPSDALPLRQSFITFGSFSLHGDVLPLDETPGEPRVSRPPKSVQAAYAVAAVALVACWLCCGDSAAPAGSAVERVSQGMPYGLRLRLAAKLLVAKDVIAGRRTLL